MRIKILLFVAGLFWGNGAMAASASSPVKTGDVPDIATSDVMPKLIKQVDPVYPYNQARAGVDGVVMIEFVIDPEGKAGNPYVIESNNPAFERPALDAVMQWRFSPGLKAGKPVYVRANQRIEFRMDQGGRPSAAWRIVKAKNHSSLPPELRWDEAPVPLSSAFPVYPFAALKAETKGTTRLSFVVGPEGNVVKATVVQATTPEMGLATLAMIDAWHFTPAKKKDGTPVFALLSLEHDFNPSGFGDVPVTHAARGILRLLEKHPEKIVSAGQLDQRPKPISRRPPVYPITLNKIGQAGKAVIEFFIDEEGDAQLPRIVSSTAPEFGYAAAQAVATWRFEPAKKGGKAVVTRVQIPIEFNQETPKPTAPDNPALIPHL